jgi:hypothetical protein
LTTLARKRAATDCSAMADIPVPQLTLTGRLTLI